ncbi:VWA domain-containing protein [Thermogladius sp. KZ2Tp1]|uniref:vWA domain-containing protein n=1 Tax=Thermogladius sp. KZ2Tp1 TaxID=3136289 RepID=UPI003DA99220
MSYYQHVSDEFRSLVDKVLDEVYERAKSAGRIPTGRLEDLARIRLTLELLNYEAGTVKSEVIEEFYKSNLAKREPTGYGGWLYKPGKESVHKVLSNKGKRLRLSDVIREGTAEEVLNYVWLRANKALYRDKSGKLVIDKSKAHRAVVEERPISARDVLKYLKEVPSRYWAGVITSELLTSLDYDQVEELVRSYYGHSKTVDKRILDFVLTKAGGTSGGGDKLGVVLGLSKRLGKQTSNKVRSLVDELVSTTDLRDIEKQPLAERWAVVSSLYRDSRLRSRMSPLSPLSLAGLTSVEKLDDTARNKALLGKALRHYLNYVVTGDQAERQAALYYAGRVEPAALEPQHRAILEKILSDDQRLLLHLVSKVYPDDTLELVSMKLSDVFSTRGLDYVVLERAIKLSYRVFERARRGVPVGGRKVRSARGRLDVRSTLFNYTRFNYRMVFEDLPRKRSITAVVDVSGSMLRYSMWTLVALASVIELVDKVVLFWDRTEVVRPPVKKTRPLIYRFLERVYTQRFKGYTNISQAIRVTVSSRPGRLVVLVSDLQQTVRDVDPWLEVQSLIDRGIRVVVVAPPRHNRDVLRRFESIGCETVIVKNPSKIPIYLKKRLNIKI